MSRQENCWTKDLARCLCWGRPRGSWAQGGGPPASPGVAVTPLEAEADSGAQADEEGAAFTKRDFPGPKVPVGTTPGPLGAQ